MNEPVSIVVPALDDAALLGEALAALVPEIRRRGRGDEILVVDDSGDGALAAPLREHFPEVSVRRNPENLGFARALGAGIAAARHPLVFAMNSDVRVRPGFLEPLAAELARDSVFAAVPRILLRGREHAVESLVQVRLEDGIARAAQPFVEQERARELDRELAAATCAVPFPIGGAFLLRRAHFERLGGFDPAFEPFYLEDLDLGWRAWKAGLETRYVGASVVEHHHRGTIGKRIPEPVVLAAIERNRLLFTWKHLDEPALLAEHVRALARRVGEARVSGDRTFLGALCLALEDRSRLGASLASRGKPQGAPVAPAAARVAASSGPDAAAAKARSAGSSERDSAAATTRSDAAQAQARASASSASFSELAALTDPFQSA